MTPRRGRTEPRPRASCYLLFAFDDVFVDDVPLPVADDLSLPLFDDALPALVSDGVVPLVPLALLEWFDGVLDMLPDGPVFDAMLPEDAPPWTLGVGDELRALLEPGVPLWLPQPAASSMTAATTAVASVRW